MRPLFFALTSLVIISCTGNTSISTNNAHNSGSSPGVGGGGGNNGAGGTQPPAPDTLPPGPVTGFIAKQNLKSVSLSWSNPGNTDFAGVIVRRSTTAIPNTINDGTLLYQGNGTAATDAAVSSGVTVHYAVFSYDTSANYSSRVSQSLSITPQVFLISSSGSSYQDNFFYAVEYNGLLYFSGRNTAGKEQPYVYDGSVIADIPKGPSDHASGFDCPTVYSNLIVFSGRNAASATKIYYFNGTEIRNLPAGTSDLLNGSGCVVSDTPIIYNNKLYFGGMNASNTMKLYEFDGTTVRNVPSASDWVSAYQYPIVLNNRLYFSGNNSTRQKIYYFDGFIRPITTGSDWNYFFFNPIAFGTTVIFEGRRNSPDMEERLYTIPGGTSTVLAPISGDYFADFSMGIVHNGNVYFRGATNTYLRKIYRFNGGSVGGVVSGTVNYASGFEYPVSFAGTLYFQGYMTPSGGTPRAFYYDGVSVKDLPVAAEPNYDEGFTHPAPYNGELFFYGMKWGQGQSVYIWNGSQLRRINKGVSGYKPGGDCYSSSAKVYNGTLVFLGANDNFTTCRLHVYNSQ